VVCWFPFSFIRSSITFLTLVSWPGYQIASFEKGLGRIQRFIRLWITRALCTTPTGAMIALSCLPALDLVVQVEARSAAHRSDV